MGNYLGEIEELGKTAALYGYPGVETHLKQAYAVNGHRAALRQWIRELENLQNTKQLYMPAYLATVYGELGDREKVFYWLEEAYRSHISNLLYSRELNFCPSPIEFLCSVPREGTSGLFGTAQTP
jgi:hypothetical protein